jgi:hypothetical protein
MPQRDLVAELRTARVTAPAEVRERVRLIAAAAPPERRRLNWRLAVAVAVPVAAAVAATVVFTRPSHHPAANPTALHGFSAKSAPAAGAAKARAFAVPTTPKRVQTVGVHLSLRVASVSDAVKRAVAVAASLSGYAASVHAQTSGTHGAADLTLKIPRANVQKAVARLSALGTITSESIDLADEQAGLNTNARAIQRLRAQLAATTDPKQRAAIVARIQAIQRKDAATRRAAHYATVKLHLATPPTAAHHHRDWWNLAWAAGGAAVLALLLLAGRLVRRLREERLLSRS